MFKLIAYDLDGVLLDACEWHYQALNKALKEVAGFEINRREHEITFNGLPTKKKLELLSLQNRVSRDQFQVVEQKKQQYTIEIIEQQAKSDPEKIKLHTNLKREGFKLACVTNSIGQTATLMLERTGQLPFMDIVIHNQKVSHPKPHPEPYIKAMVYLRSLPEETIIVEDSETGLKAARNTGAHIWQVKNATEVTWENFSSKFIH